MTIEQLLNKVENFNGQSQAEQVKLISFFYCVASNKNEFTQQDIRQSFTDEFLDLPSNLPREVRTLLGGRPPVFLQDANKYSFHRDTWKELNGLYLDSKHAREISTSLRSLIAKIKNAQQKAFLDEAIVCFEVKCFRASIIITWLLVMDVLYEYVIQAKLTDFSAAVLAHGQYKKLIFAKKEDFSDMKESTFLEILRTGKIVTGDEFKILKEKLDFRNTAAHPNTILIKETKTIAFVEDLIDNIISKYQ